MNGKNDEHQLDGVFFWEKGQYVSSLSLAQPHLEGKRELSLGILKLTNAKKEEYN